MTIRTSGHVTPIRRRLTPFQRTRMLACPLLPSPIIVHRRWTMVNGTNGIDPRGPVPHKVWSTMRLRRAVLRRCRALTKMLIGHGRSRDRTRMHGGMKMGQRCRVGEHICRLTDALLKGTRTKRSGSEHGQLRGA